MAHSPTAVTSAYRALAVLIRRLPKEQRPKAFSELRGGFRKNANVNQEEIPALLQAAEKKASFLRIMTPKPRGTTQKGSTRYVYRSSGEVEESGHGSNRKTAGRVHTNWDGRNLDPCDVGLKRLGFVNNAHAKGIF